jgi:hypothetical protein
MAENRRSFGKLDNDNNRQNRRSFGKIGHDKDRRQKLGLLVCWVTTRIADRNEFFWLAGSRQKSPNTGGLLVSWVTTKIAKIGGLLVS